MPLLSDETRFLLDATTIRDFTESGMVTRQALIKFMAGRGVLVFDVEGELEHAMEKTPAIRFAIKSFLKEWSDEQRVQLPRHLQLKLADLQAALRSPHEHPNENIGERAMMLYAAEADPGHDWVFVSGDNDARNDAGRPPYNLKVMGTRDLVLEMVCAGAMKRADGLRVWKKAHGAAAPFEAAVVARCPDAK